MTTRNKTLRIKGFEKSIGFVRVVDTHLTLMGGAEDYADALKVLGATGNGNYEVFATVQHLPGIGPRVTSVRIEFVTQEELQWMEQELLEPMD